MFLGTGGFVIEFITILVHGIIILKIDTPLSKSEENLVTTFMDDLTLCLTEGEKKYASRVHVKLHVHT